MSDLVEAIDDTANAWCAVLSGPRRSEPVLFSISSDDGATARSFPLLRASCSTDEPEVTLLGSIGELKGPGHPLKEGHVKVSWSGSTGIELGLCDLGNPDPKPDRASSELHEPLQTGIYHFLIHTRDAVLFDVYVKVKPGTKPKEAAPAGTCADETAPTTGG